MMLGIVIIYLCYEAYLDYNDKNVFVKLTGISKFEVVSDTREAHYFYIVAKISPTDKQILLKQHYYKSAPINLNGNIDHNLYFINENDYLYYLEDSGHGYLGYVLYLISKTDNQVIVYTNYAD